MTQRSDLSWQEEAACLGEDTGLFFPGGTTPTNKVNSLEREIVGQFCIPCPVKGACLEYAMRGNERWGVWGGMTSLERKSLRRARARQPA